MQERAQLAKFVALHEIPESACATFARLTFAVIVARAPDGVVLAARNVTWLGVVEVSDGATHFGGVFGCETDASPENFQNEEIGAAGCWPRERRPSPLGHSDAALLNRFG